MTAIKRLNYFTGQFLVEKDFEDEQKYHLEMRRRHNRYLHSWGIADGLQVAAAPGNKTITVSPGLAIDIKGNEIVLLDPFPVDLKDFGANAIVNVTARYVDDEWDDNDKDRANPQKYIRRTEKAKIEAKDAAKVAAPATGGSVILLATVKLNASGNIVDNGVRRLAGPAPGAIFGELKIADNNTLEFGAGVANKDGNAGKIGYQAFARTPGAPKEALDIVGAGTSAPNRKIMFYAEGGATFNGGLTVAKDLTVSGLMKITGTNTLEFGADVAGKHGDAGKIGYQKLAPNDALDIVGAGTTTTNRKIKFHAEGGATFNGSVTAESFSSKGLTVENALTIAADGTAAFKKGLTVANALTTLQNGLTVEKGATVKNGLTVEGDVSLKNKLSFGTQYGASLVFFDQGNTGTSLEAGVQDNTLYHRSSAFFAWYLGGKHTEHTGDALNPGDEGARVMSLTGSEVKVAGATIRPGLTVELDARVRGRLAVEGGATIKQEDWKVVAASEFKNNWVNYGGDYNIAAYFKDSLGIVHLTGLVKDGAAPAVIFTLPPGYRPASRELHIVCTNNQRVAPSSNTDFGRLDITKEGDVIALSTSDGFMLGDALFRDLRPDITRGVTQYSQWISLDGITFRAARNAPA